MLNLAHKHCIITGGSSGLGRSLACQLARRGAHVSVLARRTSVLEDAVAEIQACAGIEQRILGVPANCVDRVATFAAIECAIARQDGAPPSLLVCCVGASNPKTFLAHADDDFESHMRTNYLSAVYAIRAALPRMLAVGPAPGHIVLVSSVAGLLGFGGYSAYAPAKAALKALADALRHELSTTSVRVHLFLPASFESPGYKLEMDSKPQLTRLVEAGDPVISADACAKILMAGLDRGDFAVTTSRTGDIIRCAGLVHSPPNSLVLDFFKLIVAFFILNFWRRFELDAMARRAPAISSPPRVAEEDKIAQKDK